MTRQPRDDYPPQQRAAIEKRLAKGDRAAAERLRRRGFLVMSPEEVNHARPFLDLGEWPWQVDESGQYRFD